ncbi:MAG: PepSY domain-containing protein [Rhodospirillum sp.]|nr:PepSY domain-containing protein [Rhodospirillum sp.]MCF8491553.1 PepSY domain-containing protein [Rhodospirillum sp.]MCF8501942.1 PepSY domain-containing protein [Rhodospirillum sp.]
MKNNRTSPLPLPGSTRAAGLGLALVLGASLLAPIPAWADRDDHDRARDALRRGDVLPLTEILDRVQAQVPGRFLEVELEGKHGALVYELKIMDDQGRITRLYVDAATGEILKRRVGGHD